MTSLASLIRASKAILLDFDGPVCGVFAGHPAPVVAGQLRHLLEEDGVALPPQFDANRDPLKLLAWVGLNHPHHTQAVDDLLIAGEVEAAQSAKPTEHAREVISASVRSGRPVAIVSNNAAEAIHHYLALEGIAGVSLVVGRAYGKPEHLKPHPIPVTRAVTGLGMNPADCILIGDSEADMQASRAAGVIPIGYTKGDFRGPALTGAGAEIVIDDMAAVSAALEAT